VDLLASQMDPAPWSCLVNLFVSSVFVQICGTVATFHALDLMISPINLPTHVNPCDEGNKNL